MTSLAEVRVLFIATEGPRRGNGQFAQYISIARALGVRPLVAVPGSRRAAEAALALGADVVPEATPAVIGALRTDVVVVDDPITAQINGWIIAAQRAGAVVVTLADLGINTLRRSAVRRTSSFLPEPATSSDTARFEAYQ
jgi:hypothetical protein